MALAHSTPYSFYHYIGEYLTGDQTANNYRFLKRRHIEVKEAFVAAGWVVLGSFDGNGIVYNDGSRLPGPVVPGTDSWGTDPDNLSRSPTSTATWCLLQCPAGMGVVQVCIGNDDPNTGDDEYDSFHWAVSVGGLFMNSGGGADGTDQSFPTAPDQIVNGTVGNWTAQSAVAYYELHAAYSNDGTQFFLFGTFGHSLTHFMAISLLENPDPTLEGGIAFCFVQRDITSDSQDAITDTQMATEQFTSALWKGRVSGVNRSFYLGGPGYANNVLANHLRVRPDKSTPVGRCSLYSNTLGIQDFYGRVPDLYWSPAGHYMKSLGDAVGGDMNWFSGGSMIIPWDKLQPQVRYR